MSVKKQFIEVAPGHMFSGENESMTLNGFICPYCGGNGKFNMEVNHGEYLEKECKCCKGTGRLKAMVEIAWVSDEN